MTQTQTFDEAEEYHRRAEAHRKAREERVALERLRNPKTTKEKERAVWNIIQRYQGRRNVVTAAKICDELHLSPRSVRSIVAKLVDAGRPIYGSKRPPFGYFCMVSADEFDSAWSEGYATVLTTLRRIMHYKPGIDAAGVAKLVERDLNKPPKSK